MNEFYGSIKVKDYDDFVASIQFIDPYHITKIISQPESSEDNGGYGLLNLPRDSSIFDLGHGTGKMGELLS